MKQLKQMKVALIKKGFSKRNIISCLIWVGLMCGLPLPWNLIPGLLLIIAVFVLEKVFPHSVVIYSRNPIEIENLQAELEKAMKKDDKDEDTEIVEENGEN